jgi:hypothetical protein
MSSLNNQFAQLGATINKTSLATRTLQVGLSSVLQVSKSIGSTLTNITKHFVSWSTVISTMTTMLGMGGGGLFGIERFANSIMAKRRQVMGIGGTYGELQANRTFNQPLFGNNTGSILQNIALGMHGNPDQLKALSIAGVQQGTKKSPEEILDLLLKRVPEVLKTAPKGYELTTLKSFGYGSIFSDPDLLRLAAPGGADAIRKREKDIKANQEASDLSPDAQDAWTNFSLQLTNAGTQIQTILGEKLASLAGPLTELSASFMSAVRSLMNSSVIERIIRNLKTWLDKFSSYIKEDKFQKGLKAFEDELDSWLTILGKLKVGFDILATSIEWIIKALKLGRDIGRVLDAPLSGPGAFDPKGPGFKGSDTGEPMRPSDLHGDPRKRTRPTPTPIPTPSTPVIKWPNPPATPPSSTMPQFTLPPLSTPSSITNASTSTGPAVKVPGPVSAPFSLSSSQSKSVLSMSPTLNTSSAPQTSNKFTFPSFRNYLKNSNIFQGGGSHASKKAGAPIELDPIDVNTPEQHSSLSTHRSSRMAMWAGAASRAVPRGNTNVAQNNQFVSNEAQSKLGPLSSNNWQSTRTASLVIRNVPGANVFMTGAGMSV